MAATQTRHTAAEVRRRVRHIVRQRYGSRRVRVQIGWRDNQEAHRFPEGIEPKAYWDWYEVSDDGRPADLAFHDDLSGPLDKVLTAHGAVLHIYVEVREHLDWMLDDILTVWTGTADREAVQL